MARGDQDEPRASADVRAGARWRRASACLLAASLLAASLALTRAALAQQADSAGPGAHLAWSVDARLSTQALAAVAFLSTVETRGLRPADYDAARLGAEAAAIAADSSAANTARLAQFDADLSRAVERLLIDLHAGRANPRALGFALPETHQRIDFAALVREVSQASDVAATIAGAEPRYAGYAALEAALARYRSLANDTALTLPRIRGTRIRPGDTLDAAPALRRLLDALGDRQRLAIGDRGGDGADSSSKPGGADQVGDFEPHHYTPDLVAAITSFQRRHALEPDGIIGPATVRQLRVPMSERVRQIELTLERWRWLPDTPPVRYAVVNLPAMRLVVFENDSVARQPVLAMNVIVGQAAGRRGTPVFVSTLDEVVFRPYWDVPPSIARKELIPQSRRQPDLFGRDGFEIVRGAGDDARVYPTSAANVDRVLDGTLRLRQRPGPANALGFVKFVFPNRYNVYLHDTPARELFSRTRRDLSHGCIRVENPLALAKVVLRGQQDWSDAQIEAAMQGDSTVHVRVARPVAVYILYATAVAGADGVVRFYPDLYGHDAKLARLLAHTRPSNGESGGTR
jgi:murein L,D-transpeptidase YcbB/YkuD